jgi:hypothetical protein
VNLHVFSIGCKEINLRNCSAASQDHRVMKPYEAIAVEFATALVQERWHDAHRLLNDSLRKQYSPESLQEHLSGMFNLYAEGPARRVYFDPQFSMEQWPAKQAGDVGWAYVSVEGDDFVEAVTVIVSQTGSGLAIRDIEWGRP